MYGLILLAFLGGCSGISQIVYKAKERKSLNILVIDTGFTDQYPQFNRYITNYNEYERDTHGHGTHVTTTILNGACEGVKVTICKYWDNIWAIPKRNKEYYNCLKIATNPKFDIINYSSSSPYFDETELKLLKKVKGRFIAAAGNEGHDIQLKPKYLASYNLSNITIVGNSLPNGKPNPSSNHNANNMVWERGTNVWAYGLNGPEEKTGTSMAAAAFTNKIVKAFCKK